MIATLWCCDCACLAEMVLFFPPSPGPPLALVGWLVGWLEKNRVSKNKNKNTSTPVLPNHSQLELSASWATSNTLQGPGSVSSMEPPEHLYVGSHSEPHGIRTSLSTCR